MKPLPRLLTILLLASLASLPAAEPTTPRLAPDTTFSQIAQPSGFTPEMPKLSDVCMRLFRLDQKGLTAERMLVAGSDFHITRGVWSYIEDESFIQSVRAKGWEFQGSLCMTLTDPALALRDREGKPIGTNGQSDKPPFRAGLTLYSALLGAQLTGLLGMTDTGLNEAPHASHRHRAGADGDFGHGRARRRGQKHLQPHRHQRRTSHCLTLA